MNPVIGDRALDHIDPKVVATMSDTDKIRFHLAFALKELQSATNKRVQRRAEMLEELGKYIQAGQFPCHDYDTASPDSIRKPCFIDSHGTPCAVANLMMASGASESMISLLASDHKLDTIEEMIGDEKVEGAIKSWAAEVGLEPSELKLIQPTYEFHYAQEKADRNQSMFKDVVSRLRLAIEPSNPLDVAIFGRDLVTFGICMRSRTGATLTRNLIPNMMEVIDQLDGEVSKAPSEERAKDLQALVSVLRKEVDVTLETSPGDYASLLSKDDLEGWETKGRYVVECRSLMVRRFY